MTRSVWRTHRERSYNFLHKGSDAVKFTTVALPAAVLDRPFLDEALWHVDLRTAAAGLPHGAIVLRGLAFDLGPTAPAAPGLWLGQGRLVARLNLPEGHSIGRVLIAHGSIPSSAGRLVDGAPSVSITNPGQDLADHVVEYADGSETRHPVHRRFETNDIIVNGGERAFAAVPHRTSEVRAWQGPHARGAWGLDQTGVGPQPFASHYAIGTTPVVVTPCYWLWSI